MAAHVETGTLAAPRYESRNLDHLGLVAGIYDERVLPVGLLDCQISS